MPCSKTTDVVSFRKSEKVFEFDQWIAHHTGVGRSSLQIGINKRLNDLLIKGFP